MNYYRNLGKNSGIRAYQIATNGLVVQFSDGSVYEYTYSSAGREAIDKMKILAKQGLGLNSYINKKVRKLYSRRLK